MGRFPARAKTRVDVTFFRKIKLVAPIDASCDSIDTRSVLSGVNFKFPRLPSHRPLLRTGASELQFSQPFEKISTTIALTMSTGRPRVDSLVLESRDAMSVAIGAGMGLLAFSRDFSEFVGGAIFLSLLLLALKQDEHDNMRWNKTNFDEQVENFGTAKAWIRVLMSWGLLWTALASLEVTTTRWSTPLSFVYAFYFVSRNPGRSKWMFSIFAVGGVVACLLSAKWFAELARSDGNGVLIALVLHALLWTANVAYITPTSISFNPKSILLDAPMHTFRDAVSSTRRR